MNRGTLLSSIRFAVAATTLLLIQQPAIAAEGKAQQAIELLARAQTMDAKCKFLDEADQYDLSNLMARAELALAQRTTIEITKQALARGRNAGSNAMCNDAERAEILLILSSAKQAAAQAPVRETAMAAAPEKPVVEIKKSPRIKVVMKVESLPKLKTIPKSKTGLVQYANITERYYLARRCGNMSSRQIAGFYQNVVNTHEAVLATFGRSIVAKAMQKAESKANSQSCS
jgi:hypothetical protein